MPKFYTLFIGFSLSILALNSCVQEPDYSTTPEISFASIRKINKIASDGFGGTTKIDSLIMSINFKDGDGDLGITEAEVKANAAYKDFKNFIVDAYIIKNNKPVALNLNPALGGRMNFKFNQSGKKRAIEGTVDYSSQFAYAFYKGYSPLFTPKNDTLQFDIKIVDNAFHQSNVVRTDRIVIFQD